jgi:Domain of unknown function (DUF1937)
MDIGLHNVQTQVVLDFTLNDMSKELIYLACPYTHQDHSVMVARFNAVNLASAKLMEQGKYLFSPISHTHPIAEASQGKLPREWDFWEGYDRVMLRACNRIIVLKLPGWEQSKGVSAEIAIAKEMGIPIEYLEP